MTRHAFLITIDDTDNQGQTVQLANAIEALVEGRSVPTDPPDVLSYYVLRGVTVTVLDKDGNPQQVEVPVEAWIGFNVRVPGVVRNAINQGLAFWHPMEFGGTQPDGSEITRAYMIARLRQQMHEQGVELAWTLQPGDSVPALTGDALLAQFVSF